MRTLFTSDTHFGHARIIELCNRPFNTVEEMDSVLIRNWNAVVGQHDQVYHLGDFSLGSNLASYYRNRLNGTIHLIKGNHEKKALKEPHLWASISNLSEISVDGQSVILCHYAMKVWNHSHYGSWHIFGHSHGNLPDDPNALSVDVGVDCWDYAPIGVHQLKAKMATKTFVPVDHHGLVTQTVKTAEENKIFATPSLSS